MELLYWDDLFYLSWVKGEPAQLAFTKNMIQIGLLRLEYGDHK